MNNLKSIMKGVVTMYHGKTICISHECNKKENCLYFNKPPSYSGQTYSEFHRFACNENTNHRMYIEIDDAAKNEILICMESGMEDKQRSDIK